MRFLRPVRLPLIAHAARLKRHFLDGTTFITVTGSVGKTTTTQLLGAILAENHSLRIGSHRNTPVEVLTTVLSTRRCHEFSVIEVSGGDPGDIEASRDIIRAQVGVVTLAGLDHYKNYRSQEAVAAEKGKLIENLPSDGHAILNGDDPNVRALSSRTRAQVTFFGLSDDCDLRAIDVSYGWPNRLSFTLCYQGNTWLVRSRMMSDVWMVSILASVAAALAVGVTMDDCIAAIEKFEPVFGRMSLHQTQDGVNFLLDTKKGSNWTMPQAVDYITKAKAPKKTAVFGAISDTPGSSNHHYRKWTRQFLEAADRVICIGAQSEAMEKLINDENKDRLFRFHSVRDADEFLKQTSGPGELIFAKSASNLHLERIWLNRRNEVKCWLEPCPVKSPCFECRWYSTPSTPRPAGWRVKMLR